MRDPIQAAIHFYAFLFMLAGAVMVLGFIGLWQYFIVWE